MKLHMNMLKEQLIFQILCLGLSVSGTTDPSPLIARGPVVKKSPTDKRPKVKKAEIVSIGEDMVVQRKPGKQK